MPKLVIYSEDKADLETIQDQLYEYGKQTGRYLKSEIKDDVEANESFSKESEAKLSEIMSSIEDSVREIIETEEELKSDKPVEDKNIHGLTIQENPVGETEVADKSNSKPQLQAAPKGPQELPGENAVAHDTEIAEAEKLGII